MRLNVGNKETTFMSHRWSISSYANSASIVAEISIEKFQCTLQIYRLAKYQKHVIGNTKLHVINFTDMNYSL